MSTNDPTALPGGDATKGRFEWFHNQCGTIYADTLDDAIACAYHRILPSDPTHAASACINVVRVGYNAAHGSDWVAPVPVAATAGPNPVLLDIAVPGAVPVPQAPPVVPAMTPQDPATAAHYAAQATPPAPAPAPLPAAVQPPTEPPTGAPGLGDTGTLPAAPGAPDFGQGA